MYNGRRNLFCLPVFPVESIIHIEWRSLSSLWLPSINWCAFFQNALAAAKRFITRYLHRRAVAYRYGACRRRQLQRYEWRARTYKLLNGSYRSLIKNIALNWPEFLEKMFQSKFLVFFLLFTFFYTLGTPKKPKIVYYSILGWQALESHRANFRVPVLALWGMHAGSFLPRSTCMHLKILSSGLKAILKSQFPASVVVLEKKKSLQGYIRTTRKKRFCYTNKVIC